MGSMKRAEALWGGFRFAAERVALLLRSAGGIKNRRNRRKS
jgi:hypothetical protein